MKTLLAIFLLVTSSTVMAQGYMLLPIVEVYDGDTIKTSLSWRLPAPLNKVSIRISNIDTPEFPAKSYLVTGKLGRAKCVEEAELAIKAKAHLVRLIKTTNASKMKIENFKWGKYGSRIVADVKIGGVDVANYLLNLNLAVKYNGGTKTHDWCQ